MVITKPPPADVPPDPLVVALAKLIGGATGLAMRAGAGEDRRKLAAETLEQLAEARQRLIDAGLVDVGPTS
jgi:hypothetical protein